MKKADYFTPVCEWKELEIQDILTASADSGLKSGEVGVGDLVDWWS